MTRPVGGYIAGYQVTMPGNAKGVWALREAFSLRRQSIWPVPSFADQYFSQVSLLLHCEGSNNSTTFTDSSSNAFTVTANGTTKISTAQAKWGASSALFDSSSTGLTLSAQAAFSFGTGDWVFEAWIRPTTISSVNQLVDFRTTGDSTAQSKINIALVSGQAVLYVLNGIRIQGSTTLSTNTWHHIAVARSGTSTKLYVNGTQEGSAWSDSTNYTVSGSRPIIGLNGADGTQPFIGNMDDIRITKGTARGYTGSTITVPTAAFPDVG